MAEKYKIEWDNEAKTVVLQTYYKGATTADVLGIAQESADMLRSVDHTVHLIILRMSGPPSVTASDLSRINKLVPENQGHVLVIGKMYEEILSKMGEKVAPRAVQDSHLFSTLEEARQYLIDELGVAYP
ncbi:MAG: hypothetical protein KC546_16040 [Anaerolineae bacterium]|nr:hypothetical protein [Anaerolineae bacterium]